MHCASWKDWGEFMLNVYIYIYYDIYIYRWIYIYYVICVVSRHSCKPEAVTHIEIHSLSLSLQDWSTCHHVSSCWFLRSCFMAGPSPNAVQPSGRPLPVECAGPMLLLSAICNKCWELSAWILKIKRITQKSNSVDFNRPTSKQKPTNTVRGVPQY